MRRLLLFITSHAPSIAPHLCTWRQAMATTVVALAGMAVDTVMGMVTDMDMVMDTAIAVNLTDRPIQSA